MKKIIIIITFLFFQFLLINYSKKEVRATECLIITNCASISCSNSECSTKGQIPPGNPFAGYCVCFSSDPKIKTYYYDDWKSLTEAAIKSWSQKNALTNPALVPTVGSGNMGESILAKILIAIIRIFFIIGSIAVLIYFLLGGLAWITSGGEKGGLENAKTKFTAGFIGIVIIASLYAITKILADIVGIEFFRTFVITWPTIQ